MNKGNVLVMGCDHLPFEHRNRIDFLNDTKKKYKCSLVYHAGDLLDHHAISAHDHNPDGFSPFNEMHEVNKKLTVWKKAFPKMKICIGNHDERLQKACWKYGLSASFIKPISEIYEFPRGWEYRFDYYIYGVRIFHGMGYSGKYAHSAASIENQCSIAMPHLHSNAGIMWSASEGNLIFGLAIGCGIDRRSYAFNYGRDFRRKPILGAGVIVEGGRDAFFVPMKMQ